VSNDVGVLLFFQKYGEDFTDRVAYQHELELAEALEGFGFGRVWAVEHHFDGYAMSPDNFVELAYIAGRTSKIKLGIGAAILPWNDPLRVAEKAILLDNLSGGRVLLALGRGLAKMEYDGFRIPMGEARERFDEASQMIVDALETGVCQGDGPFYKQPRVEIRPRPMASFRDRLHTVAATSPESQQVAAKLGGAIMSYVTSDTAKLNTALTTYRTFYKQYHGARTPPWPVLTDVTYCHADSEICAERAMKYIGRSYELVVDHYEMAGSHFEGTKGYESYVAGAKAVREGGKEAIAKGYVATQLWGTPDQIIARFRDRVAAIGPYTPNFQFAAGGIPHDQAMESAALFGDQRHPGRRPGQDECPGLTRPWTPAA
jgi:alkanesulfonate monooxygenase SsuD/methylene tetrahydromethanopterin reductase-like flavin-dependent oxidoreductase (luciferase family)